MATPQVSAPARAQHPVPAQRPVPAAGVTHIRYRHTDRFTVVGNHLAQHRDLSLVAVGLAVRIQSLPDGARIGIKWLAAQCVEGEVAIARALRELERYGYLARVRERTAAGRWITRTYAYDKPGPGGPKEDPGPAVSGLTRSGSTPDAPVRVTPSPVGAAQKPVRGSAEPAATPVSVSLKPTALTRVVPAPAAPTPATPAPAANAEPLDPQHAAAADLLAALRGQEPRMLLSAHDVRRLAPAVAAWLELGVPAEVVVRTLVAGLPAEVRCPAALLEHRLTHWLPPELPSRGASGPEASVADPLQNCPGCERAFRASAPGRCRDCRACSG